jgi:hypothetical protein
MSASKVTEQSRRQYADLDSRYGKIGISAVVAALHYEGEQHDTAERLSFPKFPFGLDSHRKVEPSHH